MHLENRNQIVQGFAYFLGGVLVLALIFAPLLKKPEAPSETPTPEAGPDGEIGQYNDRPVAPPAVQEPEAPATIPGCSLAFSVTPRNRTVGPGGEIVYDIVLANRGQDTCVNASFSIYYGEGESFVAATPAPSASDYYWRAGDLASGASYRVTVTAQGEPGIALDNIPNEACAAADNGEDACTTNLVFSSTPQAPAPASSRLPAAKELGVWVWETPAQMSEEYAKAAIAAAKSHGFTVIYLTIDDALSIAGTTSQSGYMEALARFVRSAKAAGISVDAEAGARDWAKPDNRWKGYALIDFVIAYNRTYPDAKVRGFQYDVEPYLLPEYENDKASTLKDFVAFVQESARRLSGSDVAFTVVIPHFYDSRQAWTPAFEYGGTTAHAFTHLLTALESKPGSSVIIMAYRNFFEGNNGTKMLADAELAEAERFSTRVIVAQETGNVEPDYVTFYGRSKRDLSAALASITESFARYPSWGGSAVHYLDPFLALPEE